MVTTMNSIGKFTGGGTMICVSQPIRGQRFLTVGHPKS